MRRTVSRAAVILGLVALATSACGSDKKSAGTSPTTVAGSQASLALASPLPASVTGGTVAVSLRPSGVTIVKADGDASGKTGHYHAFVDRDPTAPGQVIPSEAGIIHTADNPVQVTGLTPGTHRVVVVLGDGAHTRLGTSQVEGTVKVEA